MDAAFGFTGHYQHRPSGLTLAPYRAYDSSLGRWISEDPLGLDDGLNLYGYVGNKPISSSDPLGLFAAAVGGGSGGTAALPTIGITGDWFCGPAFDSNWNFGILCCADAGVALGDFVGAGAQGGVVVGPTCDLCGLEGFYGQAGGDGGFKGSLSGSAGLSVSSTCVAGVVSGGAGPGFGGYVSTTTGGCKLLWKLKECDPC